VLAKTEYQVNIADGQLRFVGTRDGSIAEARMLAERLYVNVWLTEDRIHFMWLASYRPRRL